MKLALYPIVQQFQFRNGTNLVAGKIYVYYRGRTRLATIYKDQNGTIAQNPLTCDADGRAPCFVDTNYQYTIVVCDARGKELFSQDLDADNAININDALSGDSKLYIINSDGTISVNATSGDTWIRYDLGTFNKPLGVIEPLYWAQDDEEASIIGASGLATSEELSSVSSIVDEKLDATAFSSVSGSFYSTANPSGFITNDAITGLQPSGDYVVHDELTAYATTSLVSSVSSTITGQVSAEVSGQLSGKQNKLTPGVNITLTTAGVIDVANYNCSAGENQNIAIGVQTSATGQRSFAHGYQTIASGNWSHSEGYMTSAMNLYAHTEGTRTFAQNGGHAEGARTSAIGNQSHAEGADTSAHNPQSHAEGSYTTAHGDFSHAEGVSTITSGTGSHAEGYMTSAVGSNSHAEGRYNVARVNGAHAEGYHTSAIGLSTHSEGEITIASGNESHAEGRETVAIGANSHAEGYQTSAVGERSHSEGRYTITDTQYQHVEGQFNAPATGALHVIGNGTSTAKRSNVWEVYTSGVNVNGNLIASGVNIINAVNALNDFMFDTATPTGYQAVLKLNTSDWKITNTAYSAYTKKYDRVFVGDIRNPTIGNTQLCGIKNLTAGPVGIVDWKGDISRACWGSTTSNNRNNVSSWPSTIPLDVPNVIRLFSENYYLTSVDQIPTNFIEATSGKSKSRCFQRSINLRGDITPYIAAFSAEPSDNILYMFGGCTGVDNYATLSAAYPDFFANPS